MSTFRVSTAIYKINVKPTSFVTTFLIFFKIFSKIIKNFETKPEPEIKKLFNTYETFSILIFGSIAALCFFFPQQVMNIIISQASPELSSLAAYHLKLMSPVILVGALLGLYYGILVTYNKFLLPNIAPSMLSLGVILTLIFSSGDDTGFYLAIGTTIGALLQLFLQIPSVVKLGYTFKPSFDFFNNKNFKKAYIGFSYNKKRNSI